MLLDAKTEETTRKEQQNFKVNLQEGLAVTQHFFSIETANINFTVFQQFNNFSSNLNPRDYVYTLDRPPLVG